MATPNIFDNRLFSLISLTAAITNRPYVPTMISDMGLFEEEGVPTLDVWIEEENGILYLLDVKPRGGPGEPVVTGKRKGYIFRCPHIPQSWAVQADEVNFIREFNTENGQRTLQSVINRKLSIARRNLDYTIESHRMLALQGIYMDHNNDQKSLFTAFGVSQTHLHMDLATSATSQSDKHQQIYDAVEAALDGIPFTGIGVIAGKNYWTDYIGNDDINKTYLNTPMSAELRADPRTPRTFGGVETRRYRGTAAVKPADDEAIAFPLGVPGMYLTRYAPADILQAIGNLGLPYYSYPMEITPKGVSGEAQSNPLNIVTRPAAIIRLYKGAS
jgi:hypothetical protein